MNNRILEIEGEMSSLIKERDKRQKECPHENVITVDYYWGVRSIIPAEKCDDCGKTLKIDGYGKG